MTKHVRSIIRLPLKDNHKKNLMKWAMEYMKTDFVTIFFTSKYCTTLNGPDV